MINKKILLIPLLMTLVACNNGQANDKYEPNLTYERECHKVDEGFVLDGVLNEAEYASKKHFHGKKLSGNEWAISPMLPPGWYGSCRRMSSSQCPWLPAYVCLPLPRAL